MKGLIDIVLHTVDLLEAEGRAAKAQIALLAASVVGLAFTGILMIGAVGVFAASIYLGLRATMPAAGAMALTGVFLLIMAGLSEWMRRQLTHSRWEGDRRK